MNAARLVNATRRFREPRVGSSIRVAWLVLLFLAGAEASAEAARGVTHEAARATPVVDTSEVGKSIYEAGIGISGEPIQATVVGDV